MSAGCMRSVKVWKRNRVNMYYPPPAPRWRGVGRKGGNQGVREGEAGRGRISCEEGLWYMSRPLQKEQGEGDTPSPIKPRGAIRRSRKRERETEIYKNKTRELQYERGEVGGKLEQDELVWMREGSLHFSATIKPQRVEKSASVGRYRASQICTKAPLMLNHVKLGEKSLKLILQLLFHDNKDSFC